MHNNKLTKCYFCKGPEFLVDDPKDAICVMCVLTNDEAFQMYIKQSKTPAEKAAQMALIAKAVREKVKGGGKNDTNN